jgi:cystathionine beta-synthase
MVDRWVRVSDRDAFAMARRITREEGILAGESCGTALIAALDEMRRIMREDAVAAKDAVLVVIFPDGGRNYLSKLYNDEWMRANGLLTTTGAVVRVDEVLRARQHGKDLPAVVLARTTDRVGAAIDLLQLYGISQLPVSQRPSGDEVEGIVGSVSEKGLLDRAYRDPTVVERTVGELMDPPLPTIDLGASLDDAFALLSGGAAAVVPVSKGRPAGVLTKLDLLEYLAHRGPRGD